MRMCKWNKFRGNNSTTISLQSADTRKRILCRLRGGPRDPNDDPPLYRDLGWLMDSAPFFCRALPQIYSILLPFWYINFYSIWFAAIAMVIERKGVRTQLRFSSKSLSPFLPPPSLFFPFLVVSSIRFHLLLVSASGDYSKRTFRGFAHSKCAITAQSATFPQDDVMLCTLRSFRFMERCFRELFFFFF